MTVRAAAALLSPRGMGGLNRAVVLRALVDHGPLARADLARLTGVARASIGSIVQGLVTDGILEELDSVGAGRVGKPARPLWFASGAGAVIAVELKSSAVRAAVADARGHVSDERYVALDDPGSPDEVQRATCDVVTELGAARSVLGVGIAVPGTTDTATGEVVGSAQVPGAVGTHLVTAVRRATQLPAYVENDSRAQAVAEQWFGLGRGMPTYTSVQTGEGLGAGFMLGGTLHRGVGGTAGEVGHQCVQVGGGRCVCGKRGCWETIATRRWLRRTAAERRLPRARSMDCAALTGLADEGDVRAIELLGTYAANLAVGLSNLRQILATEDFILHGDVVGGGEPFRVAIEQATKARSLGAVRVAFTELGDHATLLGAVGVVLSEQLHVST